MTSPLGAMNYRDSISGVDLRGLESVPKEAGTVQ